MSISFLAVAPKTLRALPFRLRGIICTPCKTGSVLIEDKRADGQRIADMCATAPYERNFLANLSYMKMQVVLRIDHKETFPVFIVNTEQETGKFESGMEKHVSVSGKSRSEEGSAALSKNKDASSTVDMNRLHSSYCRFSATEIFKNLSAAKEKINSEIPEVFMFIWPDVADWIAS
jgi:hypothetical protein